MLLSAYRITEAPRTLGVQSEEPNPARLRSLPLPWKGRGEEVSLSSAPSFPGKGQRAQASGVRSLPPAISLAFVLVVSVAYVQAAIFPRSRADEPVPVSSRGRRSGRRVGGARARGRPEEARSRQAARRSDFRQASGEAQGLDLRGTQIEGDQAARVSGRARLRPDEGRAV